ncbi:hypothetical protein BaRGS_00008634 [Batillaria attramentaria]|uniref:Uncharacterized protein n=1 Tax=Batillaria attramentaria TaxID=370345 RepID=A0ABD0LKL9_9CAEN
MTGRKEQLNESKTAHHSIQQSVSGLGTIQTAAIFLRIPDFTGWRLKRITQNGNISTPPPSSPTTHLSLEKDRKIVFLAGFEPSAFRSSVRHFTS